MADHDQYMHRALELAQRATGCVTPNPLVGAVVVQNGAIVGEGWHQSAGTAHAEVHALENAGGKSAGSTLYVTLEPCSHFGRTPPCTEAIIKAGVSTVVYAVDDPNPQAAGGGAALEAHGLRVVRHVLKREALHTNRFFFHFQKEKTPYVVAKFAASLDGKTATRNGHSQWITGPEARHRGHQLRQAVDAIVVGADTAIQDNPSLTVRLSEEALAGRAVCHPIRIVLDSSGRVPLHNNLFDTELPGTTVVATTDAMSVEHEQSLNTNGVDVWRITPAKRTSSGKSRVCLHGLCQKLGSTGIQSLMVEGGQTLLGEFRDAGLIQEIWAFLAPVIIGGEQAPGCFGSLGSDQLEDALTLSTLSAESIGNDVLIRATIESHRRTA
ncbi:MAG: bifunctional diaminohydroxyphosphoribosylaminopyrimidine deaminase/5-amino-6-(5-phosphoribosylamino)uracil reductase RibD [Gammaproteobacteria bacterium]|nr:bifunctional diaminohydroxyphosphoribosylaminopyrimidine deaminase/5-amino-6-(5-phosphoribosylamino)uracil reductase RibD [Gammaproteobacteria bacterium]